MSERGELKRMGAKAHKNSGRGMVKGDGSLSEFVIDVKEYTNGYRISTQTWAKICMDAMSVDRKKSPMLQLVLKDETTGKIVRLSVVEWSIQEDLIERANNADND